MKGEIRTFTGHSFYPMAPRLEDVYFEDIAHALSMLCRYGGHIPRFYSVAEHSVYVGQKTGLHGLLHDAAESYLLDLPTPIKRMMPFYEKAEEVLLDVIYEGLGIKFPTITEIKRVKIADKRILATEMSQLLHNQTYGEKYAPYKNTIIHCYSPTEAEILFKSEWERLLLSEREKQL